MTESWRVIAGYEHHYEISDCGRVRSLQRASICTRYGKSFEITVSEKILGQRATQSGHMQVTLYRQGKRRNLLTHRLVLESFAGPCPPAHEGCHNDGNPGNNAIENLRWDTRSANQRDAVKHGSHVNAKKSRCACGQEYELRTERSGRSFRFCRDCTNRGRRDRRVAKTTASLTPEPKEIAS